MHTQNGVSVSTQTEALQESSRDSGPSTSSAKPTSSSLQNSSTTIDSTAPVGSSTEIESSGDRPNDDQEMIRKRRLERFTQSNENGQVASTENSAQGEK